MSFSLKILTNRTRQTAFQQPILYKLFSRFTGFWFWCMWKWGSDARNKTFFFVLKI